MKNAEMLRNLMIAVTMVLVMAVAGYCTEDKGNEYSRLQESSPVMYKFSSEEKCFHVKFEAKFFIGSQVEFDMPDDVKGRGIVRAIKIDDSGKIKYFVLAEDNDSLIEFSEEQLRTVSSDDMKH